MKVFIIGATGLIGSEAARQFIALGDEVSGLALPPIPSGAGIPLKMKVIFGNYMDYTDGQLKEVLQGFEALVFAAGVDERVEAPGPIYDFYKKYNIDSLDRVLRIAKEAGIRNVTVCGSYFAYFAKLWPQLKLDKYHPYIRSRVNQETMALSHADDGFDVSVLELPYIFGTQPGRKPVWTILVKMIRKMKRTTYYTKGGTAMVTVRQVGEAIVGAVYRSTGAKTYPIGYYNMDWTAFLKIVHKHMGYESTRKIVTVPGFMFTLAGIFTSIKNRFRNIESGLNLTKFHKVQTANLFIDPKLGSIPLGVTEDDIDLAIGQSIRLSLGILNRQVKDFVDMKVK